MAHYGTLKSARVADAVDDIHGSPLYGLNDEKLGKIDDVIFDHSTKTFCLETYSTAPGGELAVTKSKEAPHAIESIGCLSFMRKLRLLTPEKLATDDIKLASQPGMIAGNPKSCRTLAACAVVLVLLIVVSTAFIAARKRAAPVRVVPLHPSIFFVGSR
jgi:hypothetical protein